jgi:hypothetical protein
VSLRGAADARRVDFDFDSREKTFQIRIDAAPGVLPDTELPDIIDSIDVH